MKINVLPTEIANMIAAGEVVERPASIVKELVENSVDAGAGSITIEIKKGGISYIRVTDDGCGIEPDEILTAFKRHATSKIKSAADLNSIYTLGFRGEALASIAAVARVEIFSKTKTETLGSCAVIEGGEVLENDEAGCSDGTTVIVRNLFYNTPARMKFLKNDATETGYITDVINKLILCRPNISVRFINNGKTVINSNGDGRLLSSIYTVFGKDYAKNMREVCYEEPPFKVTGFIGNSNLARKDRRHQIFFVNKRNIVCKIMSAAVSEAYKNTVMTGRFPVCILNVRLDPNLVDVNVHPTKMEVRFSEEKRIYNLIYWAVKNALNDKKYVPEMEISVAKKQKPATGNLVMNAPNYDTASQVEINLLKNDYVQNSAPTEYRIPREEGSTSVFEKPGIGHDEGIHISHDTAEEEPVREEKPPIQQYEHHTENKTEFAEENTPERFNYPDDSSESLLNKKIIQNAAAAEEQPPSTPMQIKADVDFRLVGQIFGTYIIIQRNNQMLIIDQHAAHERIYFERLLEESRNRGIEPQMLLMPVTMTLDALELKIVEQNIDFFDELGFGTEVFGTNSILIRYTPAALEEQDIKDTVSDIIGLIAGKHNDLHKELFEEALHTVACKKALKGNHVLSDEEMKALAEQVLSLGEGINTCPHGRPIMITMSKYSLEKQFKRIV